MELSRVNLKVFLDRWEVSPDETFKTFNNWISDISDETLVDVADYSHVHGGPITLLVGHEANYCIDESDGRLGLLYARKRQLEGDLGARLLAVLRSALNACSRLEREEKLRGRVSFRGDQLQLIANDRLEAPNSAASMEALRTGLEPLLNTLFDGAEFSIEHDPDTRNRLSLMVSTSAQGDISTLFERLNA
jgi:hypothetical protein